MTVTALQSFLLTGVDAVLGRVDLAPIAGGETGRKKGVIIETVSIRLEPGMQVEGLMPGYWTLCDCESEPRSHPRLSSEGNGRYRLDTFDIEPSDTPVEIPGVMIIVR